MLKSKNLLFVFPLLFAELAPAQNWILNGDFEVRNICSEFHAKCAPEAWFHFPASEPVMPAGPPAALSGQVAETVVVENFAHPLRYRIFLYTRLVCPLVAGQEYTLRFYLHTLGWSTRPLGILLTKSPPETMANDFFNDLPILTLGPENELSRDKYGWRKMEITFVAQGGEEFLTFGNFSGEELGLKQSAEGYDAVFMLDVLELLGANGPDCTNMEARIASIYNVDERHTDHLDFEKFDLPADTVPTMPEPEVVLQSDTPTTFVLPDIGFDFGQYTLRPEADSLLQSCAEQILLQRPAALRISGYTDDVGSDAFNLDLSQKRAAAVRQWFVERYGLPPAMFEVEGRGESVPLASNDTEAGRAANRRVEITFVR